MSLIALIVLGQWSIHSSKNTFKVIGHNITFKFQDEFVLHFAHLNTYIFLTIILQYSTVLPFTQKHFKTLKDSSSKMVQGFVSIGGRYVSSFNFFGPFFIQSYPAKDTVKWGTSK